MVVYTKAGILFSSKKKFYALRFVYLIIHIMVVYVTFNSRGYSGGIKFYLICYLLAYKMYILLNELIRN